MRRFTMKNNVITLSIPLLGIACAGEPTSLIPAEKISHYHGTQDAVTIYENASQQSIGYISEQLDRWKNNSQDLTVESFF